jgi:hypothetical protein
MVEFVTVTELSEPSPISSIAAENNGTSGLPLDTPNLGFCCSTAINEVKIEQHYVSVPIQEPAVDLLRMAPLTKVGRQWIEQFLLFRAKRLFPLLGISMSDKTYRLVTRSDFDGLVCAVLLKEKGLIHDILFVHPKDMQDGKIEITDNDITTNLPYVASAHLAFDHHLSETIRNTGERKNHVITASAPSAARVVYDYYGGKAAFPTISEEMMAAVDQADSAQYSLNDILSPEKWT